jgi:hypothetical protein
VQRRVVRHVEPVGLVGSGLPGPGVVDLALVRLALERLAADDELFLRVQEVAADLGGQRAAGGQPPGLPAEAEAQALAGDVYPFRGERDGLCPVQLSPVRRQAVGRTGRLDDRSPPGDPRRPQVRLLRQRLIDQGGLDIRRQQADPDPPGQLVERGVSGGDVPTLGLGTEPRDRLVLVPIRFASRPVGAESQPTAGRDGDGHRDGQQADAGPPVSHSYRPSAAHVSTALRASGRACRLCEQVEPAPAADRMVVHPPPPTREHQDCRRDRQNDRRENEGHSGHPAAFVARGNGFPSSVAPDRPVVIRPVWCKPWSCCVLGEWPRVAHAPEQWVRSPVSRRSPS